MIINNQLFYKFAIYFSKNLETTPLTKAKQHLITFLQAKPQKSQFQSSFSAYQSFLHRVIEDNKSESKAKIEFFDLVTQIYMHYNLSSKKLFKLHNMLAEQCLSLVKQQPPNNLIPILIMLQRYNRAKALALFKANKELIKLKMKQFQRFDIIRLLTFFRHTNIDDPLIRQASIEILFDQIDHLNPLQIDHLLRGLAQSKKYINRQFLTKLGLRMLTLYRCNNILDRQLYGPLASLSQIQANLHTRAIYVEQLDELYELTLPVFLQTAQHLPDNFINRLVSALRRSKYFNQACLTKLADIVFSHDIRQLTNEKYDDQIKKRNISLRTFLNIVHTHAVFNYHHVQFKKFALQILKIMMMKDQMLIQQPSFTKLLWSLCVLYDRSQLATLYPMIDRYLAKAGNVPIAEATSMYYCYLYLRTTCPQINEHRDKIHELLSRSSIQSYTSKIQTEVYNTILQSGVPCIPQYSLNNIPCDIMIPEWKSLKNVIVELHGFKHFCRNVKRLTGSNALKEKIISNQMYKYYYITVDEWLVVQDKKAFIKEFLEYINQTQQKNSLQKSKLAKKPQTSTRVRGRPSVFKISAEKTQLLK